MAWTEDLTVFFDTDNFSVTASYTPVIGSPSTIDGIFDSRYVETENIQGQRPVFTCNDGDIATISQEDVIVINGTTYGVANWERTGNGVVTLVLRDDT